MKIPKIIHQTWKSREIPSEYKKWVDSWKIYNPDFEYRLWTDEDNRNLIKTDFPEFLHLYDALPLKIHRIDAVRYFILFKYGGVYADLDFECLKSIAPLLAEHELVVASEPREHCERLYNNRPRLICNAWMASTAQHPFWVAVIHEIAIRFKITNEVLGLTGPTIIDDVFTVASYQPAIYKMYEAPSELLYPIYGGMRDSEKGTRMKNAYCAHHWKNSWTNQLAVAKEFAGFYFYPGQDALFNDIERFSSLEDAYKSAKTNPNAVAFNTDNNVKSSAKELKICWPNDKGIYIKENSYTELDGYMRIEDVDIEGADICRYVVRDLENLKQIADANPWCLAFNSKGYLKNNSIKLQQSPGMVLYIKQDITVPKILDDFDFYPYRDSPGNDIEKNTSIPLLRLPSNNAITSANLLINIDGIKQLADICLKNPNAVAFNLDGAIKNKVNSIEQLVSYPSYRFHGIFIKK